MVEQMLHKFMISIIRFAVIVGILASALVAAPAGWAPLGALLRRADAVVVVTIASVSGTGANPVLAGSVLRSIKGRLQSGSGVNILVRGLSDSAPLPKLGGMTCIVFLKEAGPFWEGLPVMTGNFPPEMGCISVPPSSAPVAAISGMVTTTPEDALGVELFQALESDPTAMAAEEFLTIGMSDIQFGELAANLQKLAGSTDARTRRAALSLLLRRSTPLTAPLLTALDFTGDSRGLLARSLCLFRGSSTEDVEALGRLTVPALPSAVRGCAVFSLRATHSVVALPILASLLDDASADVRYDAVIGIASYALGMPAALTGPTLPSPAPSASREEMDHYPSRDVFSQNEHVYLTYWKVWLTRR